MFSLITFRAIFGRNTAPQAVGITGGADWMAAVGVLPLTIRAVPDTLLGMGVEMELFASIAFCAFCCC